MDCRTARTLMAREQLLAPDERHAFGEHLVDCAACRDDHADPLGRALTQTTIELALPPPDFTARLMQRLPQASPLELARQTQHQQRRRWLTMGAALLLVSVGFVLIGSSIQPLWNGTTLGLVAHVLRSVALATIGPLLAMIASAAVVALLLQTLLRRPATRLALSSAALACVLLATLGLTVRANDEANISAESNASIATLFSPITATREIQGDVVSLGGDITINYLVEGNVASLFGNVTLAPTAAIAGDVLAGTGSLEANREQIVGQIRRSSTGLELGAALLESDTTSLSQSVVRGLTAMLGALMTLALAGLVVMLWPQRTLRTSRVLPTHPWLALGLGTLITVLLALLALPVLALLALTVVGLLLVPVLLMVVHLPYVQGLAAVGQALGQRLTGSATIGSALWGVALQLLLVLGLGLFAPIAGLVMFYLLASLGLGAQVLDRRVRNL